jgi:hypothetical protein
VVTQKTMKEGFSDIKSVMQHNVTLIANVLEKQQQNNVYQQRSQNPMKSLSGPIPSHQYQNQAPQDNRFFYCFKPGHIKEYCIEKDKHLK